MGALKSQRETWNGFAKNDKKFCSLRGRRKEGFYFESWCISIQSFSKFIEYLLRATPTDAAVNKRDKFLPLSVM